MSLASEMTQLVTEFASAHDDRRAAVRVLQAGVRSDLKAAHKALLGTKAEVARAVRSDLDGIFGEVAVVRGRAADLIDRFSAERTGKAKILRADLETFVQEMDAEVEKLLTEYSRARDEMSLREVDIRDAYLKDVRIRVNLLLTDAAAFLGRLRADRVKAAQVWRKFVTSRSKHSHGASVKVKARTDAEPSVNLAPAKSIAIASQSAAPAPIAEAAAKIGEPKSPARVTVQAEASAKAKPASDMTAKESET